MFDEQFPYYLAMGMSQREFWDQDVTLARAYRKAFEIKQEQRNSELWLQGLYIYEAILDASPVLQAFAKSGTRPRRYSEKPYDLKPKKRVPKEDPYAHQRAIMEGYMKKFNGRKKPTGGDVQ